MQELEHSQRDCRNAAGELFRVRNGHAECMSTLDEVRRENKGLSDDIRHAIETKKGLFRETHANLSFLHKTVALPFSFS